MDSLFRQKLLGLRAPQAPRTFSEAILGDTSWMEKVAKSTPKIPQKENFSEKVQVIESLERFAHEKASELNTDVLKVEGGEIAIKNETGWNAEDHSDAKSLFTSLKLSEELKSIVLGKKNKGDIKALFVSEKFRNWDEIQSELKEGFINELIAGFPLKTAELFERMIMAMKLTPSEVIIYPVEGADEADFSQDVMEVSAFYRPEVIITLGARATQKILKSNDRLTLIHGQFFARKVAGETFQVVPLFHPSIIETNANMKKTAWTDMQKIMKHLKKLP